MYASIRDQTTPRSGGSPIEGGEPAPLAGREFRRAAVTERSYDLLLDLRMGGALPFAPGLVRWIVMSSTDQQAAVRFRRSRRPRQSG